MARAEQKSQQMSGATTDSRSTSTMSNLIATLGILYLLSFKTRLFSCDLQRILKNSPASRHFLLFVIIFLFNTSRPDATVVIALRDAFAVYILYLFASKAKWTFVAPTLLLLVADQVCQLEIKRAAQLRRPKAAAVLTRIKFWLDCAIVAVVVVGMTVYLGRQYAHFGARFDVVKFFLDDTCNL